MDEIIKESDISPIMPVSPYMRYDNYVRQYDWNTPKEKETVEEDDENPPFEVLLTKYIKSGNYRTKFKRLRKYETDGD